MIDSAEYQSWGVGQTTQWRRAMVVSKMVVIVHLEGLL